jgi:hypothetical protein
MEGFERCRLVGRVNSLGNINEELIYLKWGKMTCPSR